MYTLGETKIQCALLICITEYSYYILLTRNLTISTYLRFKKLVTR